MNGKSYNYKNHTIIYLQVFNYNIKSCRGTESETLSLFWFLPKIVIAIELVRPTPSRH